MSGIRVLSSPLQLQGVLGTSDSGKSCRAYSSLNKQGCQTCPDTRNNFDACRWRTRVVSEVEYWKRAYDHLKFIQNASERHPSFLDFQKKKPQLVTDYVSYRLNLYKTGVPDMRWHQEYISTPAVGGCGRCRIWIGGRGLVIINCIHNWSSKYIRMISLIAWYSLRPEIHKCYVQTAQATLQATPL